MATIADVDAAIAALTLALGTGEKRVRFADGREVEYRTPQEMRQAIDTLRRERDILVGGVGTPRFRPQFFLVRAVRDF